MKNYIRENFKTIIAVTLLLVCTVALIGTNELVAKMLPEASELECIVCRAPEGEVYEYTGETIEPAFTKLVFKNKDGEAVIIEADDYDILEYENNVEIGFANLEIALEGYRGSIFFENAFEIVLGQVKGLQIANATKTNIDISWAPVVGADGYFVYRSSNKGLSYQELIKIETSDNCTYQDLDIALNTTYFYKVCAYKNTDSDMILGKESAYVKQTTPLEIPVLSSVGSENHETLKVEWNLVPGAVGYQVYRSTAKTGEYECIAEITDKTINFYVDSECSLGKTYFYYMKACQQIEEEKIFGEPSAVLFGETSLNKVSLSGSTNSSKTSASLKWKKTAGATGYEIYRSEGSSDNYKLIKKIEGSDTLSWSESGLTATVDYTYKVRAYAIVDGITLTGSYSGTYEKPAKINYNYSSTGAGSLNGITGYVGYPYAYGGKSPSGWDCSGFTSWVMNNLYGVNISLSAEGQALGGEAVSVSDRSSWQAGDILCYKNSGRVKHVAIYLGNGKMIHALNEKYDTFIQDVDTYERWDDNNLAYVRRYLD